jgi:hypothetical protein
MAGFIKKDKERILLKSSYYNIRFLTRTNRIIQNIKKANAQKHQ